MSNEIIPFDAVGSVAEMPAHLAELFGDAGNIAARQTINQLSYRGKVWRRIVNGEETMLTRMTADLEEEPLPIVSLVVLDHNKARSRSFYEGAYEEGKNVSPSCYSSDGVTPDASVKEPCATSCATCPNAAKGSKITEAGKATTACSAFKRVAVVPSANIGQHPAMLLRLAQTSIWDKDNAENEAKGWYSWDQYLDMLRARGIKHTATVETRVKFDMRVAYPKLLFSAARWLSPDEAMAVKAELTKQSDDISKILSGGDADGLMSIPVGDAAAVASAAPKPTATPAPAPKAAAPKPPVKTPAPTPALPPVKTMTALAGEFTYENMRDAGWSDADLIEGGYMVLKAAEAPKPPKPPAPKASAVPKPPAAPKATAAPAPIATRAPAAPAPAAVSDTPADLADLLAGWDDSDTV